jgi:two-component system, chemotaxis family, chemotaxis protein CheY
MKQQDGCARAVGGGRAIAKGVGGEWLCPGPARVWPIIDVWLRYRPARSRFRRDRFLLGAAYGRLPVQNVRVSLRLSSRGSTRYRISAMSWSILLVDDSATARAVLRAVLLTKGVKVLEAENGKEGLWRTRTEKVDLIFTDVHMPVMDGLQMIREIRALPAHEKTPIFVLTSDGSGERALAGKNAGANAWIIKPVNPAILWKVVEKALLGVPADQRTDGITVRSWEAEK